MQLLVSVSNVSEALAAVAGGADVIDAKDPLRGPLGAVAPEVFRDICAHVGGARPVTAALGDASDDTALEQRAQPFAADGAAFVKIGFAGIHDPARAGRALRALVRELDALPEGTHGRTGVVAVAYADSAARSLSPNACIDVAVRAGARGVLLDTFDKAGPGVRELVEGGALARWVSDARGAGLIVAVAGRLTAADILFVRECGADIAGVRGAACEGGRTGQVVSERVRALSTLCGRPPGEASRASLALRMSY